MNYYLLLSLFLIHAVLMAKQPIATELTDPKKTPKLIISAHRGASGYEPENTLRAFTKAIEMGAPMIELDVHLSKDGRLVVIHDYTTKDGKKIEDLTLAQLQQYDVGKGERIPLLSQVLDAVNQQAILNIELKAHGTPEPVAQLLAQYIKQKKADPKKFLISSFDHFLVKEFHSYAPGIPTAVIFEGNPIKRAQIATDAGAQAVVLQYKWISPEFIKDAHARGIKVYSYTVNDRETALTLQSMGIDGIITNYPDLLTK